MRITDAAVESFGPIASHQGQSRPPSNAGQDKSRAEIESIAAPIPLPPLHKHTETYHQVIVAMNRQPVLTDFHPHGHHHPHAHVHRGHYEVPAQSHYQNGLAFAIRAPVLPSGSYNHYHTGHHQHPGRQHQHQHRDPHLNMAVYPSDEEYAQLQKLSSEYEPEAIVSERAPVILESALTAQGPTCGRAPKQRCYHDAVCHRRSGLPNQNGCPARQICLLPHLSWRWPLWMAG